MWRNIQLGKDRVINENVRLIHKLHHEAHGGKADGDGHHPFTCLASAELSIWPLISGVQQRSQHSCLMSHAIFRSEFVTAACFVGEQSLAGSNTLGHNCIVQRDHVDVLTRLLWPVMSLNITTRNGPEVLIKVSLNWYFRKRAHLSKPLSPSKLCDGDIDEVGVVDHLILNSYLHATQTVLR